MPSQITGRLAPSPTGGQHLGNARTFLLAWLSVRSQGGRLLLRIEDIDSPRVKVGADQEAIDDLRWLGLDWDDGPIWQTQRLPLYQAALARLQAAELVYPCTCSRRDIENAASAPHVEHEGPRYPGTCPGRRVADAATLSRPFAWRFRASDATLSFADGFRGQVDVPSTLGGDFVVWKSSGRPAYQLAVVVDDAAQGVTEVLRGDDLIPSTPRQLQLYAALGWRPPSFCHVPLVVGADGNRLAKRHGDTRLAAFRAQGVKPEAIVGLLAWSCGWLPKPEAIAPPDLLSLFNLKDTPRDPFVVTPTLLRTNGLSLS